MVTVTVSRFLLVIFLRLVQASCRRYVQYVGTYVLKLIQIKVRRYDSICTVHTYTLSLKEVVLFVSVRYIGIGSNLFIFG